MFATMARAQRAHLPPQQAQGQAQAQAQQSAGSVSQPSGVAPSPSGGPSGESSNR